MTTIFRKHYQTRLVLLRLYDTVSGVVTELCCDRGSNLCYSFTG